MKAFSVRRTELCVHYKTWREEFDVNLESGLGQSEGNNITQSLSRYIFMRLNYSLLCQCVQCCGRLNASRKALVSSFILFSVTCSVVVPFMCSRLNWFGNLCAFHCSIRTLKSRVGCSLMASMNQSRNSSRNQWFSNVSHVASWELFSCSRSRKFCFHTHLKLLSTLMFFTSGRGLPCRSSSHSDGNGKGKKDKISSAGNSARKKFQASLHELFLYYS